MFSGIFKIVAIGLLTTSAAWADADDWGYRPHHHRQHYGYGYGYNPYYGGGYAPPARYYPAPQPYFAPAPPANYYGYVEPVPMFRHHHRERW